MISKKDKTTEDYIVELEKELRDKDANITKLEESLENAHTSMDIIRHDLGEKIAMMITSSALLLENSYDEELVKILHNNSKGLWDYIEDIFYFSKMDLEEIKKKMTLKDLNNILDDSINGLGPEYVPRVNTNYGSFPHKIMANGVLHGAFENLLKNAFKYGPEGAMVDVTIEDAEDRWQVRVRDYGPGIPDEFKDKVFDRGVRVPNSDKPGTGLGLAIARRATEIHGGTIELYDAPGSGTIVDVKIPKAESYSN